MKISQEQIREAALRLFVADGMRNVTMRRIANELGVSATALYRHYESKEMLLLELVKQGFAKFYEYELQALKGKNAWQRMNLLGDAYWRFAVENPNYYKIIFGSDWPDELKHLHDQSEEQGWMTLQFVVDRINDCIQSGILKPVDANILAISIWGMAHGLVSLYLCGAFDQKIPDFKPAFDASFQHIFNGLYLLDPNTLS
jgi:AcrR family transcriptional regulator